MFFVHITAMRSASWYGRSRRTTARSTLKMAAFAPTPRASVNTATAVKPGLLMSERRPYWRSWITLVIGCCSCQGV